ncbi:serine hydrolase domain-containing protein [Streptomyces sp. B6B3]|uniref:serine hydrolase domain-containing protein n=1 Tax=Streptomyces sp. B6B3 TaxID=3153570 RepID=UPI00325C8338
MAAVATAFTLSAVTASAINARSADGQRQDEQRLQDGLDALTALGITGAQARLIDEDGGHAVATSGVADLDTGGPVSPEGHFRMGSTTKTFTATVVLQLVGEGRLSLDDTVDRWLPGVVQGNGNDGSRITLRHLLQHTSGIDDSSYPYPRAAQEYYDTRFNPTPPEQIVADAMTHQPLFEPGEGWSYANTGYVILGMVIEAATGDPWYEEVEARVIEPLGLTGTGWPGRSPDLPDPHATAYMRFAADEPLIDVTRLINVDASGGLITTTDDLNRFFRALLGGDLLPPQQLRQMKDTVDTDESVQSIWPGATYGLGIMNIPLECGGSYWGNSGSDPGWGNDNGVTENGRRSVVASWSTEDVTDPDQARQQAEAFVALTNDALCSTT